MYKKIIFVMLLIWIAFGTACSASNDRGSADADTENETITIEHELDTTEVMKNPETVVVFDFGILDSMDQLGLDVAGVPQDLIPSYLEQYASDEYANVGSLKEPDFDKIAEINPDLIIISARQANVYEQLAEIAPTIHLGVEPTRYMESFKENMATLGEIFDKEREVESELEAIDESISALKETAEANADESLVILANDDKISAYGPKSRFGLIHDVFGLPAVDKGVEASTHGMNVSFEYVMEQNPDILYVIDRTAAINEGSAAKIVENELVENTTAFKNDDIYYLDPDVWYLSGGGLISVQKMVDEIAASLDWAKDKR